MANLSRELQPVIQKGSDNLAIVTDAFRELGIDVSLAAGPYLSAEAHRKETSRGV